MLPSTAITIKAPPRSEDLWIAVTFPIKTFVAGLLALYVAFWLALDEPRWALLTVYIVSQPESGLVLAKRAFIEHWGPRQEFWFRRYSYSRLRNMESYLWHYWRYGLAFAISLRAPLEILRPMAFCWQDTR
jgi:hypothetical protein